MRGMVRSLCAPYERTRIDEWSDMLDRTFAASLLIWLVTRLGLGCLAALLPIWLAAGAFADECQQLPTHPLDQAAQLLQSLWIARAHHYRLAHQAGDVAPLMRQGAQL